MAYSPKLGRGVYKAEDIRMMTGAINAVCDELGIRANERDRREAVAMRIMNSWASGRRMPLSLVAAGLGSTARAASMRDI